jgi:hypothetical protein
VDTGVVNPFINPKQRAIELPTGCKDLNDVLLRDKVFGPPGVHQFRQGGVREIRAFVRHLYEKFSKDKVLFVLQFSKSVLLTIRYDEDSFKLELVARSSDELMKEAIAEFFGEAKPHPWLKYGHLQYFRVTLPENSDDAAQVLIDFLLRACDVSEHDKFILSIQPQKILPPGPN